MVVKTTEVRVVIGNEARKKFKLVKLSMKIP